MSGHRSMGTHRDRLISKEYCKKALWEWGHDICTLKVSHGWSKKEMKLGILSAIFIMFAVTRITLETQHAANKQTRGGI